MSASFEDVYQMALQLSPTERRRLADQLASSPSGLTARDILDTLNAHAEQLRRMGVERIGVFGSHVRSDARLDSDIDILVRLTDDPYSLFDLLGIKAYLDGVFGREVDIVPEDSLKPAIRPYILEEVVYAEGV